MTPQATLRPELAAACLYQAMPKRRGVQAPLPATGILAELAVLQRVR